MAHKDVILGGDARTWHDCNGNLILLSLIIINYDS